MIDKKKLKIWIVAVEKPALGYGGSVRNFYIAKSFFSAGHSVRVFAAGIEIPAGYFNQKIVNEPKLKTRNLFLQFFDLLIRRIIPYMSIYRSQGTDELLVKKLARKKPDIILVENLNAYYCIPMALKYCKAIGVPVILDEHNVEYIAFKTSIAGFSFFKKIVCKYIFSNLKRIEEEAVREVDYVFACSEVDAQVFRKIRGDDRVWVVPNGVDMQYFKKTTQLCSNSLIFVGALDYTPNDMGLHYFFKEIYPQINSKIEITMVGKKPQRWLRDICDKDPRVHLTGFVDDIRPFVGSAGVCICPLKNGSGTRLKLLEYMAMGKPIISTSAGAEGLEVISGKEMLIEDSAKGFSNAINDLSANYSKHKDLAQSAYELVKSKYDWVIIGQNVVNLVESFSEKKLDLRVSVIVCSLNGGQRIKACLESLAKQTYPQKLCEIIVVDDGSTDNTSIIAKSFGAKVIRNELNRGIPVSRNIGLKAAAGDIVIYLDDDCVADVSWLRKIIESFKDPNVVAASGKVLSYKNNRLSERYLQAAGYGNPPSIEFGKSKNIFWRFFVYVKSMFNPVFMADSTVEVQAAYTGNAAYRAQTLRSINGFDEKLQSNEDTDVSSRLRAKKGKIVFVPRATILHRHHESLTKFIKQTFYRGENTFQYYSKEKKIAPIFPLPIIYFAAIILSFFIPVDLRLVIILFFPVLLYCWWLIRAMREHKIEYIFYGYIQLAIEIASILGLLRGAYKNCNDSEYSKSENNISKLYILTNKQLLPMAIIGLVIVNFAIYFRYLLPLLTAPVILFGIIFLPGILLGLALRLKSNDKNNNFIIYTFGLGLGFWIIGGLILNWVLPLMGILRPLSLMPLWLFFNIIVLFLIVFLKNTTKVQWAVNLQPLNIIEKVLIIFPFGIVIASIAGSMILNNFGTNIVTLLMIAGVGLYFCIIAIKKQPVRDNIYLWGMWCLGAALLLMYSLRSWHLIGWDINSEYQVFKITLQNAFWSSSYAPNESYNACLSITILPTILANFLPISAEYIFKLVMQLLFAMMPVIIFLISRQYFFSIGAALAGFLFISQRWFFEQMPALIRQETALLFFGLAILVIIDSLLKRREQVLLFLIFSACITLSHYSTAYIWIVILTLTIIISSVLRRRVLSLRHLPRRLTWPLLIISLLFVFIWDGVVTNTGSTLKFFAQDSASHLTEAFSPDVIKDGVSRILFAGPKINTDENLKQNYEIISKKYSSRANEMYPPETYRDYIPKVIEKEFFLTPLIPKVFSDSILLFSKFTKIFIIDILSLLGTLLFILGIFKKKEIVSYEYAALCLASFPLIFTIIFLPIFQINYNITRLFMQIFIVLSLAVIFGVFRLLSFLNLRLRVIGAAFLLIIFFYYSVGFTEYFTGGAARVTMNQPYGDLDTYYIYDSEVASAQWLMANRNMAYPVYSDFLAGLRLRSYALTEKTFTDIFPAIITKGGYVYMSSANIKRQTTYTSYKNEIIAYIFPITFLNSNKNLIYNSGGSKIFK